MIFIHYFKLYSKAHKNVIEWDHFEFNAVIMNRHESILLQNDLFFTIKAVETKKHFILQLFSASSLL